MPFVEKQLLDLSAPIVHFIFADFSVRTRSAHSKYQAFGREECDLRHLHSTYILRAKISLRKHSVISSKPPRWAWEGNALPLFHQKLWKPLKVFWNAFGNVSVGTTFHANLRLASFLWFTVFFLASASFACFKCWIIQLFSILARWKQSLVVRLDQFDCFPLLCFLEAAKTLLLQTPQKNKIKYFFNTHFYVFWPPPAKTPHKIVS